MNYNFENGINLERKGDLIFIRKKYIKDISTSFDEIFIKVNDITGVIILDEILLIFASGLPYIYDFTKENYKNIKELPNCIFGNKNYIDEIYKELVFLTQNIEVV